MIIQDVKIESFTSEGKGVTRIDGKVYFVEDAITGDVCDIEVFKNKKNHGFAKILQIKNPSASRVEPYCAHYEHCGGCRLQHVDYDAQLQLKHRAVIDAFQHIGKLEDLPEVLPALACEEQQYYRNKLEYTFSNKIFRTSGQEDIESNALGFHVSRVFSKVLDIEHCFHQRNLSNEIRNATRAFALEHGYSFYDLKNHVGFLRNLIIRNTATDEWMVVVVFAENNQDDIMSMMHHLQNLFPQIQSLQYIVNTKRNDTIFDQDIVCFHGEPYITEVLDGLQFRITAKSFFQVNIYNTVTLYNIVKELVGCQPDQTLYDLYCGTGTIGLYLAKDVKKVVGLELIPEAIDIARINADLNHISNIEFVCGDMKDVFNDHFYQTHRQPDVIILDPPRAGLHPKVVQQLLDIAAPRIVYVSCNPETQARDLAVLQEMYMIKYIQPVDMFPMTLHLENVVLLEKKA